MESTTMTDYIKREEAINAFDDPRVDRYYGDVSPSSVIDVIKTIPAADVLENVRGHWTNVQISVTGSSMADCSICGVTVHNSFMGNAAPNFCPNCGANMRGEKDDG